MNQRSGIVIVIILVILIIAGVFLFSRSSSVTSPAAGTVPEGTDIDEEGDEFMTGPADNATTTPSGTSTSTPAVTSGTTKSFTVTGSNFKFAPATLTVKKGDTVKLTFVNQDGTHDWNLDEFAAHTKKISGGQQETITFVADKAGTFEYYCSVGTHRQMGMKGMLTVTE